MHFSVFEITYFECGQCGTIPGGRYEKLDTEGSEII